VWLRPVPAQEQRCEGAARHLDGVWDDDVSARVDTALRATGVSYAADVSERTRTALDGYALAWTKAHTSACEATAQGEQSDQMLDRRMQCLDDRRRSLSALGVAALISAIYIGLPLEAVLLKGWDGVDDFALLAIPFFVFAGALMAEGGMARRLVAFANIFVGWVRGGLAMVNILASMFFGGISGSAVADTSSIGSIMIPMMKKQGYEDHFAVNVTIASATQGIIIPPSHNAIIYAWATGGTVSIILFTMFAPPLAEVGSSWADPPPESSRRSSAAATRSRFSLSASMSLRRGRSSARNTRSMAPSSTPSQSLRASWRASRIRPASSSRARIARRTFFWISPRPSEASPTPFLSAP